MHINNWFQLRNASFELISYILPVKNVIKTLSDKLS